MQPIESVEQMKNELSLINENTDESVFKGIAMALFNNFRIKKGNVTYRFLEVEFYHNKKDPDQKLSKKKTYPRTSNACEWFFHSSGVDITFKSDKENYGGILIRAIISDDGNLICGPIRIVNKLFDKFDAINTPDNFPQLVEKDKHCNDVDSDHIITINRYNFDDRPLGFCLPEAYWKPNQGDNKKAINKYPAYPWSTGKNEKSREPIK